MARSGWGQQRVSAGLMGAPGFRKPYLVSSRARSFMIRFFSLEMENSGSILYLIQVAWIRRSEPERVATPYTLRTIRYVPETDPPEALMTIAPDEVSEGGKITFAWTGKDLWRSTLREDLQYAHRLDGGEWSPYGGNMIRSFEDLDVGTHLFEVKARDLAFNEDPTPAVKSFSVVPQVWRRPWFIGLILGFVIITGYLVTRIIVRDRRLRQANEDLASANETQLLQSARLVSLGQMTAGVAHELNQPLTVVETTAGDICLRLMEGMPLETDELREMMEDVRGVVDRMAGTVDHLRVFSRDVSEEPRQAMDVNEVIESSLKLMGTQLEYHGIDLAVDLSDALPKVWGHPHPLEQVVLNLLSNARDTVDERAEMEGAGYDKRIQIRTRVLRTMRLLLRWRIMGLGWMKRSDNVFLSLFLRQRTPTGARVWVCRLFMPLFAITMDRSPWRASRAWGRRLR